MAKLTSKIAIPIILAGIFAATIFIALDYQQLGPNFYIILLFLIIFVFFFGLSTGQDITSPVKKLLDRATELSNGNFSSRVYLETKDELAELANIFNKLADELQLSHEQEENTEKSVGIKVQARTKELEETINALEQKVKNRTIELERLISKSNQLQSEVEHKGTEVVQIKKELNDFKQKIGGPAKQKEKPENNA